VHYYRYRAAGELALKELLYDEVFFASATECNDPFDGLSFLSFAPDAERWARLIAFAWRALDFPAKAELKQGLARRLCDDGPLPYSRVLSLRFDDLISGLPSSPDRGLATALSDHILRVLQLYEPRRPYFVSFSKSGDNALMWSHYAAMHQGHCLIFKSLEGHLHQCPLRKKGDIERTTTNGLAPAMRSAVPATFPFEDISYEDDASTGDAFSCFPHAAFGRKLSEQERLDLAKLQHRQVLTKHTCWSYEMESRVTIHPPSSSLFGEPVQLSPEERLFHFRPSQLVGVIVGARMPAHQKARIREIARMRMNRFASARGDQEPYLDFVLFQAELHQERRNVVVEPQEIFSLQGSIDRRAGSFASSLQAWREGWGLLFHKAGAEKKQFI